MGTSEKRKDPSEGAEGLDNKARSDVVYGTMTQGGVKTTRGLRRGSPLGLSPGQGGQQRRPGGRVPLNAHLPVWRPALGVQGRGWRGPGVLQQAVSHHHKLGEGQAPIAVGVEPAQRANSSVVRVALAVANCQEW